MLRYSECVRPVIKDHRDKIVSPLILRLKKYALIRLSQIHYSQLTRSSKQSSSNVKLIVNFNSVCDRPAFTPIINNAGFHNL